jgi:uncharacterized membrane protein YccC
MQRNRPTRERTLAYLAVFLFVFAGGVVLGNAGFRVDSGALGNVYGFTPHQWGTLLSGLVGSVVGSGVAIWVLLRSLDHQADLHAKQMTAQRREATRQLTAQRAEATRQRSVTSGAAIISSLWLLTRAAAGNSKDEVQQHLDAVIVSTHGLRLENKHEKLAQAISQVIAELYGKAEIVVGNEAARTELIKITALVSKAITVWFRADGPGFKESALQDLLEASERGASLGKRTPLIIAPRAESGRV